MWDYITFEPFNSLFAIVTNPKLKLPSVTPDNDYCPGGGKSQLTSSSEKLESMYSFVVVSSMIILYDI